MVVGGKEFWTSVRLDPVKDKEGTVLAVLGVTRDITERVKYEEKLRALHQHALQLGSASNIEEIVKSTLDAIESALGFDVADVYLAAGDSLRVRGAKGAPIGLSGERLDGRGLVAKAARSQATVRVSDTTKEPDYVDRKGWEWAGSRTMLSELAVPVVVDAVTVAVLNAESIRLDAFSSEDQELLETLAAYVGSGMQRLKNRQELETYSKHLEKLVEERTKRLLESEERYRSVVQNIPVMVWTSSEKGDTVFITPNVKELYGYTPEEIYSGGQQVWCKHIDPDDRVKLNEAYNALFADGRVFDVEYRYQRPDGTSLWLNDRADLVYEKDGVRYTDGVTTDITGRKQIETALRESEGRFRELADLLPQIVFEIDPKGKLTFLNRIGFATTGYGEDALQRGLSAFQMFIPEEHDRAMLKMRKLLGGEKVSNDEYTILRKDGSKFPAIVYAAPIIYENRAVGVRGVVVDITERKRAEEALRVSEDRFRGIAERIDDIIIDMNHEGGITYASPSVEPALGYKPEEMNRTRMEQYLPQSEISRIAPNWAAVMQGKSVIGIQGEMLRKDGTCISAEMNASPILKDGRVVGVQAVIRDITERKLVEKELRRSEKRFRDLAELLPQIVFETDEDGNLTFVNRLGLVSTGYTEDDFRVGVNLFQLIHPEEYGKVSESLARRNEREPISVELKVLRKDNSVFPAVVYAGAIVRERKVVGFRGVAVDITERKRMEEALLKSDRLAAIGETAAMVGHDLRNPLQGIAGAIHLLRQESLTANERDEMLQVIQDNVQYSDSIVRDLSDYSAEIQLKLAEATPKSITRDAIGAVKVPQNVTVQDLSEDQPTLRVDPDRMKRMFINLIENAIAAMPQGGTLTISSKKSDGNVEIALTDTGSGIPEKVMENLWKPLQTTKAKGLGLGLAICKRIVDAHGGTISVKSKGGEGTTVTICLPIKLDAVEVKRK
jgi:PAS domain S-box-containing protein